MSPWSTANALLPHQVNHILGALLAHENVASS
jgi:hypothetical protein